MNQIFRRIAILVALVSAVLLTATSSFSQATTYRFSGTANRRLTHFPFSVPAPGATIIVRASQAPFGQPFTVVSAVVTVADSEGRWAVSLPCSVAPDASNAFDVSGLEVNGTEAGAGGFGEPARCERNPAEFSTIVTMDFPLIGASPDAGPTGPNQSVGCPVNTATGNMWLQQSDYALPGIGEPLAIDRTYNSTNQYNGLNGLFGIGWTSNYDVVLRNPNTDFVQLRLPGGEGVMFRRTNNIYYSANPHFYGSLAKNADDTFTVTFKDGRTYRFGNDGKRLWAKDRNGNQTTFAYDQFGRLSTVTDAAGRVLSVTINSLGFVSEITDSVGVIATYAYHANLCTGGTFCNPLKSVTYGDGSKYEFDYLTQNNKLYLTTVKDALGNIVEKHEYDSEGRATTSERQGGVEKYTLDYSNSTATVPYTQVTDALVA